MRWVISCELKRRTHRDACPARIRAPTAHCSARAGRGARSEYDSADTDRFVRGIRHINFTRAVHRHAFGIIKQRGAASVGVSSEGGEEIRFLSRLRLRRDGSRQSAND